MRRGASALLLALTLLAAAPAQATSGTAFGESSRVASLAVSVVARPGDVGSMLENPAGLADISEPVVMLSGQAGHLTLGFQRDGEENVERARWLGGAGFAAATPLPGPDWLRALRVGLALYVPADHVLRVSVDERGDQPKSPIYDGRPDRISALGALAYEILPQLRVGVALVMAPTLATPTEVSYDAERADGVDRDVMVRLDRDLEMDVTPAFGLRASPLPFLGMGVAYRAPSVSHAGGSQRTVAGGIVADDPIDYQQFWDPRELTFGLSGGPLFGASASLDVSYAYWGELRSGFNRELERPFTNTLNLRAGLEYKPESWLALRGGYGFEPSPIPAQVGNDNFLGADTHVVALGAGADLRELWRAPLRVDVHARTRLAGQQHAKKDEAQLRDASASLPGRQIDNLGYPGFTSSSSYWQLGLSLTVFVGKESRP